VCGRARPYARTRARDARISLGPSPEVFHGVWRPARSPAVVSCQLLASNCAKSFLLHARKNFSHQKKFYNAQSFSHQLLSMRAGRARGQEGCDARPIMRRPRPRFTALVLLLAASPIAPASHAVESPGGREAPATTAAAAARPPRRAAGESGIPGQELLWRADSRPPQGLWLQALRGGGRPGLAKSRKGPLQREGGGRPLEAPRNKQARPTGRQGNEDRAITRTGHARASRALVESEAVEAAMRGSLSDRLKVLVGQDAGLERGSRRKMTRTQTAMVSQVLSLRTAMQTQDQSAITGILDKVAETARKAYAPGIFAVGQLKTGGLAVGGSGRQQELQRSTTAYSKAPVLFDSSGSSLQAIREQVESTHAPARTRAHARAYTCARRPRHWLCQTPPTRCSASTNTPSSASPSPLLTKPVRAHPHQVQENGV